MERDAKILKIKNDLRSLRKLNHAVDSAMRAKKRYERRIEYAEARGTEISRRIREETCGLINALDVDALIRELSRLESTYMPAIKKLPPLDQSIIIDSVINGLNYGQIAAKIDYSKRGVEERMKRIYEKLTV